MTSMALNSCRSENAILAPFICKNDDYAKTGSGQT
jgi:hypothetical protein